MMPHVLPLGRHTEKHYKPYLRDHAIAIVQARKLVSTLVSKVNTLDAMQAAQILCVALKEACN